MLNRECFHRTFYTVGPFGGCLGGGDGGLVDGARERSGWSECFGFGRVWVMEGEAGE